MNTDNNYEEEENEVYDSHFFWEFMAENHKQRASFILKYDGLYHVGDDFYDYIDYELYISDNPYQLEDPLEFNLGEDDDLTTEFLKEYVEDIAYMTTHQNEYKSYNDYIIVNGKYHQIDDGEDEVDVYPHIWVKRIDSKNVYIYVDVHYVDFKVIYLK